MTTPNADCDVLIAGQGAAGLAAALYAARYQMKTVVIGETFGGETAIGGLIENYPGQPDIDGFELMMKFREQVDRYNVPVVDDRVVSLTRDGHRFRATTGQGNTCKASTVILAVGRERRKLGLEHEDEWTGKGVSFCSTCDAPLHRGNVVVVVGGGDSALKGVLLLSKYARKVYIVYRRDRFTRPEPAKVRQLEEATNVERVFNTNIVALKGTDGLSGVVLDREYQGSNELSVDGIFIEIGADPRVDLATQVGVELNDRNEIKVDRFMRTNVQGLFAAGDVSDASGDLKQTITAAAQGALAATSAYDDLDVHRSTCR